MRGAGNIPSLAATGSGQLGLVGLDGLVVQVQNLGGGVLKSLLQPKLLAASLAPPSGRSPSSSSSSSPTYQPKQELLFQISSLRTYIVLHLVQLSLVGHVR